MSESRPSNRSGLPIKAGEPIILTPFPNGGWVITQSSREPGRFDLSVGAYSTPEDMLMALHSALIGSEEPEPTKEELLNQLLTPGVPREFTDNNGKIWKPIATAPHDHVIRVMNNLAETAVMVYKEPRYWVGPQGTPTWHDPSGVEDGEPVLPIVTHWRELGE